MTTIEFYVSSRNGYNYDIGDKVNVVVNQDGISTPGELTITGFDNYPDGSVVYHGKFKTDKQLIADRYDSAMGVI